MINTKLLDHKFIIFGSDHYNTLGAVRSLGEMGIKPDLILHPHYSKNPHLSTNSRYVGKIWIVNSVEEGLNILIKEYATLDNKPFVFSCDDWTESILDINADTIKDKFFFFNGRTQGIVSQYMDKDAISKLGEECGLTIPKSEVIKKGELPLNLKYPVITKSIQSIKGGWKKDVHICHSPEELITAYQNIASEELLIEEFIEKTTEICYDGFSINEGKNIVIPFKSTYIRALPGAYGNFFECSLPEEPELIEGLKQMLKKIGFNGIFSAEFLIAKDGTPYFLEINFRNSTWSYAMTFGGVNMLYYWAKGMFEKKLDPDIKPKLSRFKCMVEFRDFEEFVLSRRISPFKWVIDLIKTDCVFFYNSKDKRPFFAHMKSMIQNRILSRLK